jgi:hypothetical protein
MVFESLTLDYISKYISKNMSKRMQESNPFFLYVEKLPDAFGNHKIPYMEC